MTGSGNLKQAIEKSNSDGHFSKVQFSIKYINKYISHIKHILEGYNLLDDGLIICNLHIT